MFALAALHRNSISPDRSAPPWSGTARSPRNRGAPPALAYRAICNQHAVTLGSISAGRAFVFEVGLNVVQYRLGDVGAQVENCVTDLDHCPVEAQVQRVGTSEEAEATWASL